MLSNEYIESLASSIADAIFKVGYEPGEPTTRIQFMSGEWPDNEKEQGGLCLDSLRRVIALKLKEIFKHRCCPNENRNLSGGCSSCGDPCL